MVRISTRDADRIILSLFGVAEDRAATFLERLKQLRHLGVPSGVPKGRGMRSGRSMEQMVELTLAIHLIDAGLSSAHVARLMKEEWSLASAALEIFNWQDVRDTSGEALGPPEAFWLAEPEGLAQYRGRSDASLPRLATLVLFKGDRLQDKIDEWVGRRGWTVAAIRAGEVIQDLLAKYLELGIAGEDDLQAALADYSAGTAGKARELLRDR